MRGDGKAITVGGRKNAFSMTAEDGGIRKTPNGRRIGEHGGGECRCASSDRSDAPAHYLERVLGNFGLWTALAGSMSLLAACGNDSSAAVGSSEKGGNRSLARTGGNRANLDGSIGAGGTTASGGSATSGLAG